jgi:hypothetical protein
MIFEETVLTKGTKVFKGLQVRGLLGSTRYFFVTTNPRIARAYGRTTAYQTKRPLRLFQMTPKNVQLLISEYKGISRETRTLLRFALGVGTTRARQVKAYRALYGGSLGVSSQNRRPGQRLSVYETDHVLAERLAREFLVPERYDGYYAPGTTSVFHSGRFHAEIMLCDASRTLERLVPGHAPRALVDQRKLPELFVAYCKTHRRLTRLYGGFILYLGGGMGVKLYLEARALKAPAKVRNTKDFDFTFAVPRPLRSKADLSARVFAMRQVMSRHIAGFISWLGLKGVRLVVKDFVPPITVLPATGKKVYQVVTYKLQFPGQKPIDFIDTTLAYVPGVDRSHLHLVYTRYYGIPLERLKYTYKNVLTVLAGSFVYPGIRDRNPLYGNRPEKGLKNTARLAALVRAKKRAYGNGIVKNFIKRIEHKNVDGARRRARQIIEAIKRRR